MTMDGDSKRRLTAKCSFQNPLQGAERIRLVTKLTLRAHVFHGSTEVNPWCSTHRIHSLGRTTLQFHLDGFCIQCCSFLTDPGGKANFLNLYAFGPLQVEPVSAPPVDNGSIIHNERLILFISLAICCIASIAVVSSYNILLRTR